MPISLSAVQLSALERKLQEVHEEATEKAIRHLAYIGEQALVYARDGIRANNYKDQTRNLRGSTSYVVLRDGRPVVGAQPLPSAPQEGQQVASQLIAQLATQHPRGLALIVVAGMHYAIHLESRGYDVLSGAEATARRLARQLLKATSL